MKITTVNAASAVLFLAIIAIGCESDIDRVKAWHWANNETTTFRAAFETAFENGVWTEIPAGKKEKVVQFTGKISPGLHEFAVSKMNTLTERILISMSMNYLASLVKSGKVANDPALKIHIGDYPINKSGMIIYDFMEGFTELKDNRAKAETLISFYRSRYWESGTDVLFQWRIYARGKIIRTIKASNPHWDNDILFSGMPENILKVVFDYHKAQPR